jgi:hypothetical protein
VWATKSHYGVNDLRGGAAGEDIKVKWVWGVAPEVGEFFPNFYSC